MSQLFELYNIDITVLFYYRKHTKAFESISEFQESIKIQYYMYLRILIRFETLLY